MVHEIDTQAVSHPLADVSEGRDLAPSVDPTASAQAAFASVAPELSALPAEGLLRPNVDIARAAATALAAARALRSLRSGIVATIPTFPIGELDRLEVYALAAWYADVRAANPAAAARALAAEGAPLRAELRVAATALVAHGLVDSTRIAGAGSGTGHLDIANGLLKLSSALDEAWSTIDGRTAVTRARVDRAATLGTELLVAVGARDRIDRPEVLDRVRAFTRFMNAYDACRRVVAAVRWREGDAASFAPSVFARRGRRKASPAEPDAQGTPSALGGTVPAVVIGGAPTG